MQIRLAWLSQRRGDEFEDLTVKCSERLAFYSPLEIKAYRSEDAFWVALAAGRGRTAPVVVLLDGRGKQFSSEEFAAWIGRQRDGGVQLLVFAVGPADGWSAEARAKADLLLSFGKMTLPHGLARVVLTEQVYRAFTILAGHPYHRG